MAQKNTGTKISELAKNFKLKNKEVIDILEENGVTGKTHTATLEKHEMNVFLESITKKNEASNEELAAFWNRKKPEPAEKKTVETAEAKAAKSEEKAAAKAAEAPSDKAAKTAVKEETKPAAKTETAEAPEKVEKAEKVEVKPEPKSETKVEAKPESKPAESVHAQQTETKAKPEMNRTADKPAAQTSFDRNRNGGFTGRTSDNRGNGDRKPYGEQRSFGDRKPYDGQRSFGDKKPYDGQRTFGDKKPYDGQRTFGDKKPYDGQRSFGDKKPYDGQRTFGDRKPYDGNSQQGGYGDRKPYGANANGAQGGFDRPQNSGARFGGFDKPAFGQKSSAGKPQNKNGFRPGGGKDDDYDSQSVRQPSIRPIYDKDGRARSRYKSENGASAENSTLATVTEDGTRLVDIRAREIDLSKYDDKFDRLAGEAAVSDEDTEVKIKKSAGARGANGRINRNESAAREIAPTAGKFQKNNFKGKGKKGAKGKPVENENVKKFTGPVILPEQIMISDLAAALKITTGEVIKKLLMMGLGMDAVGATKTVDFDTAYLVADEMGITAEKEVVVTIEEKLFAEEEDKPEDLEERSPVVVVMGHVDHGKTSLLDAIRHTHVTAGEAGGITQHIGAYRVKVGEKEITFLDTPGHEAFTAMRARGAQATDIAILVVAADDGIMPQTVEAINHAKAAGVSIIVAINKMDKVGANPDAVKQALMNYELIPEEWGGDTICVPVSAIKRTGIDELLEMVTLVADMKELKANPHRPAKGIVIEAKLDKGRGPVATVLVQNGTLHAGDIVIAGMATGRVRAMCDDNRLPVKSAGPSVPVEIIGLSDVPDAGDEFRAVADERMARELVEKRKNEAKEEVFKANSKVSLDDLFSQINDGVKELAVIIKADVQGSAEAVKSSLEKLSTDEVKVKVIHSAVGGINESDVMLADASNAIIIGFNVRPDKGAMDSAEMRKVDIRTYRVIYECIEEVTAALNGMLDPDYKEVVLGHAEVRQTIHVPGVGTIAGSYVRDGKIQRNAQIRVVRDGIVIFEDKISSLKRFKDDVKDVSSGYECGIGLERFNDIKEGDVLEAFIMEEVKREIKVNN